MELQRVYHLDFYPQFYLLTFLAPAALLLHYPSRYLPRWLDFMSHTFCLASNGYKLTKLLIIVMNIKMIIP